MRYFYSRNVIISHPIEYKEGLGYLSVCAIASRYSPPTHVCICNGHPGSELCCVHCTKRCGYRQVVEKQRALGRGQQHYVIPRPWPSSGEESVTKILKNQQHGSFSFAKHVFPRPRVRIQGVTFTYREPNWRSCVRNTDLNLRIEILATPYVTMNVH
jgi:hypothetical protein